MGTFGPPSRRASTATLAVALTLALAGCSASAADPATAAGGEVLARELFDLTNAERAQAGEEPLVWSDCLAAFAAERARPFIADPDLAHDVLVAPCTDGVSAGENLSRSDRTAPEVVDAWMGSAGHRANLLSPDFAAVGVACLPADGAVYSCAQVFEGASVHAG